MIVLDLDGTLLDSGKRISQANREVLARAAELGTWIVPSTGRFYDGMPRTVRELPYVRYVITVNGAQLYDAAERRELGAWNIPPETADSVFAALDALPCIYDCYMDGWGWMDRKMYEQAEKFAYGPHELRMLRELRRPVENFRSFIRQTGHGVQKIQMFFADMDARAAAYRELKACFPGLNVTSSIANNIEINSAEATKGAALRRLCELLKVPREGVLAFGDGLNDVTMLREAGVGIAMANASPEVRAAADEVTADNDHDGVARAIWKYLPHEEK